MTDNKARTGDSAYQRLVQKLLKRFPAAITPLRLKILIGYTLVVAIGLLTWDHIESAWRYLAALLAPIGALLGALLALKLGVVLMSLFTLLTSIFKVFSGFLMVVIKPGVLKAIVVPPLMSLIKWLHSKSARLQHWVDRIYESAKGILKTIIEWWSSQSLLDKLLLSGFLIPVLLIIVVLFLVQRATAVFAGKKLAEQIVQRTTKFFIKQFHRIPIVGNIPGRLSAQGKKLTRAEDRKDLAQVLKNLGGEIYKKNTDVQETAPKS